MLFEVCSLKFNNSKTDRSSKTELRLNVKKIKLQIETLTNLLILIEKNNLIEKNKKKI